MAENKNLEVIKDLIETCRDGELGYREAAEHLKDPKVRDFFLEQSRERSSFASELQNSLSGFGEYKKESGSVAGSLHRAWIDFKSNVGLKDEGIIGAAETGEDAAVEAYEEALGEELPPQVRSIVERQFTKVKAAHDRVKQFRDARKAA